MDQKRISLLNQGRKNFTDFKADIPTNEPSKQYVNLLRQCHLVNGEFLLYFWYKKY
jgi:hypothetical protein